MFGRKEANIMVLPALLEDLSQLAHLHQEGFPRGWSKAEMQELIDRPENVFFVARLIGKPDVPVIGFVVMRETAEEAEILSIAVDPSWRGRDVGERLMREAINRLLANRVPSLFLEVDENNIAALRLYQKLGFKQVGSRAGYYRTVDAEAGSVRRSAALVMRLELS